MKILVGYIGDLQHNGIDKYLLNIINIAPQYDVSFDFVTSDYHECAKEYLDKFGFRLFKINNLKKPQQHYADVKKIISENHYDAAYFNISEPLNMMGAKAAHDAGLKVYIHSHNSGMDIANKYKRFARGVINKICKLFLYRYGDEFFACSEKAASWLYPEKVINSDKFTMIYNAVDTSTFKNDPDLRKKTRDSLNIGDKLVIGHIGRFTYAKNSFFLVDIMQELVKLEKNSVMLCIGEGEDKEEVMQKAKSLGVDKNMMFLGFRNDISAIINAMDVFVLPSRVEGFPIVAVEAQLSGKNCILSDKITSQSILTDKTAMLKIDSAKPWAEKIIEMTKDPKSPVLYENVIKNFSFENQQKQIINKLFKKEI